MVRAEYIQTKNTASIAYLDGAIDDVYKLVDAQTLEDRMLNAANLPWRIVEHLYLQGISQGLVEKEGVTINSLKIAQLLIDTR